jgi:hypothetical protein
MGNQSSALIGYGIKLAVLTGFVATGVMGLMASPQKQKRTIQIPVSPVHMNESFLSMESVEGSELEGEIERTATFIANVKWLMENESGDSRKRQLEETLSRAKSSFNNLFELKSKLEQYETNGVLLGSQVTSEIAKSAALRDIEERLLFSGFAPPRAGDSSPYKRQRTQTS